jgi:hypothetical protein
MAASLAKKEALSRSAFFERFERAVGVAPMEYGAGQGPASPARQRRRRVLA